MNKEYHISIYAFAVCAVGFVVCAALYNPITIFSHTKLFAVGGAPEASPPTSDIFQSDDVMSEADEKAELDLLNEEYRLQSTPFWLPVDIKTYCVKEGDNFWSIAEDHGIDWYTLLSINNLKKADNLSIGQKLKIPNQRGIIHEVQKQETLEDIFLQYDVPMSYIVGANQLFYPEQIRIGLKLFIPNAKTTPDFQRKLVQSRGIQKRMFFCPLRGRITSRFGYRVHPIIRKRRFHQGVDIAARHGTPVRAAMDGRVTFSGWMGGYGKLVVVKHRNGWVTRYAHNSKILLKKGDRVIGGRTTIARVGRTGRATGSHLHFEMWHNGKLVDPLKYIRVNR